MNKLQLINTFAEIMKASIDNNPNYNEWERAYRKACEDEIKKLAKKYYDTNK